MMRRLWTKTDSRRRWHRTFGLLAALTFGVMLLAGCRTDNKQKWLSLFFDGVPQPGATNALVIIRPVLSSGANAAAQAQSAAATPVPALRPKMDVHPPYAQRDCTACHESEFSQKMIGKPGEVCFSCHTDLKKSVAAVKVKHQPFDEGDCTSCPQSAPVGEPEIAGEDRPDAVPDVS